MSIVATLKSVDEIKALCVTAEDGEYIQDVISFKPQMLADNGFFSNPIEIVSSTKYLDNMYAFRVNREDGRGTYVHLAWFDRINGEKTLNNIDTTKEIVKITRNYLLNKITLELIHKNTLPTCSNCGSIVDTGRSLCTKCVEELTKLNSYGHKPTPKFIGTQIANDGANPVWFGIENEVSTDKNKLAELALANKEVMYLKYDSSISGEGYKAEIVTHPHSFTELMKEDGILDQMGKLPTPNVSTNGLHIHISRTAFKDDKHYSLFYFLLHKMKDSATKIGGRELNNYCKFSPTGKVFDKKNNKGGSERGLFINETNTDTIEARFFISTTDTKKLKSYIQFLESLIKYTKYHTKKVTSSGWRSYVSKYNTKYAELIEVLNNIPTCDSEVVFREPKYKEVIVNKLTVSDLNTIVAINFIDGVTREVKKFEFIGDGKFGCNGATYKLDKIVSVKVLVE